MLDLNSKIHIIGGTGVMGSWLRNFLESLNFKVSISDEKNKIDEFPNEDIIFISVPIDQSSKVIGEIAPKTKEDCLIVDLSSIKSETVKKLKLVNRPALSLHFLFGPSLSSVQDQKIIFENLNSGKLGEEVLAIFKNEGAQVFEMDSKTHDYYMAHIQSLTHFINLTLAKTLLQDRIGLKPDISTPIFLSQLASVIRVLSQSPDLITDIQTLNPQFNQVLDNFLEIQNEIIKKIKTDPEGLNKELTELRKNMDSVSGNKTDNKKEPKVEKKEGFNIGFLGPRGTFSNQAAKQLFSEEKNKYISAENIYSLFEDLNQGKTDLIVAPAENTIEGTVRETLDLLFDYNFKIIGKIDLPVSQSLLSKAEQLNKIKKVISHPQALNQSRDFLNQFLPTVQTEASSSTLAPVNRLEDKSIAIIGPEFAAKIYGLNVLSKDIQNSKNNITRFYIISKKDVLNLKNRTKTLLFLSIFNRVGILRDILSVFADLSINLNKIESRPSKEKNWDYYFFVEIELTDDNPKFNEALNILKQYCPNILILGKL